MPRLLLVLDNKRNCDLLSDWLGQRHEVIQAEQERPLAMPFDLCLIDGPTLDRLGPARQARKTEEAPTFLPVVLMTSYRWVQVITRHLWQTVDDLIRLPIEKVELQTRRAILLRSRRRPVNLGLS